MIVYILHNVTGSLLVYFIFICFIEVDVTIESPNCVSKNEDFVTWVSFYRVSVSLFTVTLAGIRGIQLYFVVSRTLLYRGSLN